MLQAQKTSYFLLLARICFAFPTQQRYPEVIPGPGLPSLASLGLNSNDLYAMADLHELSRLSSAHTNVPFDPKCGPEDVAYTNVKPVVVCYHYLATLTRTYCGVEGYGNAVATWCTCGDAHVSGQSLTGQTESSLCSDVAIGLLKVLDSCTRPDMSIAGFATPNGNGDLVVGATSSRWK